MMSTATAPPAPRSAIETSKLGFELPDELIQDAAGRIFCVVCGVYVPRGESNTAQHTSGKKHASHAQRMSPTRQSSRRESLLRQIESQREAGGELAMTPLTLSDVDTDQTDDPPLKRSDSEQKKHPSVKRSAASPIQKQGAVPLVKGKSTDANTKAAASPTRDSGIDKQLYISSLLRPEDDSSDENMSESDDESLLNGRGSRTKRSSEIAVENVQGRREAFQPLNYQAPPGQADTFWDSIAEETISESRGQKLKTALTSSGKKLKTSQEPSEKTVSPMPTPCDTDFIALRTPVKDNAAQSPEPPDDVEEKKNRNAPEASLVGNIDRDPDDDDVVVEQLPPWLIGDDAIEAVKYVNDSSLALHFEILEFERFISPTHEEVSARAELVANVTAIVHTIWPMAKVEVFGSYATNLYLPTSDIDMCILNTPQGGGESPEFSEHLELAQAIRNVKGFARRVNFIKARVPLVKIVSSTCNVQCDISFGHGNGPANVQVIRGYLAEFPALRPLLLVLKCFLQQRSLNEVFSGGLGSYSVLLLVVSHLQMMGYNFPGSAANLGTALQQLFQLYGRIFNYCIVGIRVKDGGCYYDKFPKYRTSAGDTMRFSLEDPNDESNELGRNSYAASRIRKAFNNAFLLLSMWRRDDANGAVSPLGTILRVDESIRERAEDVKKDLTEDNKLLLRRSIGIKLSEHVRESFMDTNATRRPESRAIGMHPRTDVNNGIAVSPTTGLVSNSHFGVIPAPAGNYQLRTRRFSVEEPIPKRRRPSRADTYSLSGVPIGQNESAPQQLPVRQVVGNHRIQQTGDTGFASDIRGFDSRSNQPRFGIDPSDPTVCGSIGHPNTNSVFSRLAPPPPMLGNAPSTWGDGMHQQDVGYDPTFTTSFGVKRGERSQTHERPPSRGGRQSSGARPASQGRYRSVPRRSNMRGGRGGHAHIPGRRRSR